MRPAYNEIIVCTALGTRSDIQYWGPSVCGILGDRRRRDCARRRTAERIAWGLCPRCRKQPQPHPASATVCHNDKTIRH